MRVKTFVSGGLVVKEIHIRSVPAKVFDALVRPSKLNAWFTSKAKVDLRVGGRYRNADRDTGRFLEIVPSKRLRFTWDNPRHATGSTVEIILTKRQDLTVVTLLHSGFSKKTDFEHYSSRTSGWDWALGNLKAYVEGKRPVQYEDWLASHSI